jgi:hypothetical protein
MLDLVTKYWPYAVAVGTTLASITAFIKMAQEINKLRYERRKIVLELTKLEEEAAERTKHNSSIRVASLDETLMIANGQLQLKTLKMMIREWADKPRPIGGYNNPADVISGAPFMICLQVVVPVLMGLYPVYDIVSPTVFFLSWIVIATPLIIQVIRRDIIKFRVRKGNQYFENNTERSHTDHASSTPRP